MYHDGLLVKKDGGESVFFVGDSFTPSGIDDYCLLNRKCMDWWHLCYTVRRAVRHVVQRQGGTYRCQSRI